MVGSSQRRPQLEKRGRVRTTRGKRKSHTSRQIYEEKVFIKQLDYF